MPALRKCYYEVLGVDRDADDDEIKKSFRKLALQMHPDKNLDRADEAKAEFQLLQQAYEVLSNPQERAWYDDHRLAVLRGGLDQDFDDVNIDLMPFCLSSCYKGFEDDSSGFFTVYRELFEQIIAEEMDAMDEEISDDELPGFGKGDSNYEDVVGPFYAFWESFCTRKTYAWVDEFDTRRADCRKVSRLMDKENKKKRQEAKKDWNQKVRALVDFVKRKDKRVQVWKVEMEIKLKEQEAAMKKKLEDDKARRIKERKELYAAAKQSKQPHHEEHKLQELENWVNNEFGNESASDESEDEEEFLHCAACNKSFRTDKAFENHAKSKKHIAQVELLRNQMEGDDELFMSDVSEQEDDAEHHVQNDPDLEACSDHQIEDIPDIPNGVETLSLSNSQEDESASVDSAHDSDSEILSRFIKNKKGHLKNNTVHNKTEETVLSPPSSPKVTTSNESKNDKEFQPNGITKKKRRANKNNKGEENVASNTTKSNPTVSSSSTAATKDPNAIQAFCVVCKQHFSTRSKLFRHLKSSGHAAPPDTVAQVEMLLEKQQGKKGKSKVKKK